MGKPHYGETTPWGSPMTELQGVTCHVWNHAMLLATRH